MAESSNSQDNNATELTMCDVLEEEQELEEDANAVLGGSDDTNCSYDKGYVSRQALYACTTCSRGQEPSGVCLACSYKCHDGHEIVELYTKRNFRCDCGNSKFPDRKCSLKPDKEPVNSLNKYNQNFKGLYCTCSRPYPDLEDDTPDEMIQCVICEDWYHGRHIGVEVPEEYFEMICCKCMESHKFLYSYLNKFHYVSVTDANHENNEKCNGFMKSNTLEESGESADQVVKKEIVDEAIPSSNETHSSKAADVSVKEEKPVINPSLTEPLSSKTADDFVKEEKPVIKQEISDCKFQEITIHPDGITSGPAFWPDNWRKELCKCLSCLGMYIMHKCEYLINLDDTILAYEERGKSTTESQYDKGLTALSQMDRVKQMEAIRAYNKMKGQLKEYLKDFANNKRTVCESDIKEFFDRMGKRQKSNNGVPHFCR